MATFVIAAAVSAYVGGSVWAYLALRRQWRRTHAWESGPRVLCLFLSAFGPISVIIALLICGIEGDEPAKW